MGLQQITYLTSDWLAHVALREVETLAASSVVDLRHAQLSVKVNRI